MKGYCPHCNGIIDETDWTYGACPKCNTIFGKMLVFVSSMDDEHITQVKKDLGVK